MCRSEDGGDGVDDERRRELLEIRGRAREAAEALEARAAEVLELTKRIEDLTDGTPGWYPGMRARVEAAEALRQVRVLVRTLEGLDEDAERRTA
jgi:hypothetical protein